MPRALSGSLFEAGNARTVHRPSANEPAGFTHGRSWGNLFFQQVIPRQEIGDRHTEGLTFGFPGDLFIMGTDLGIGYGLPGIEDRFPEALAVCLLRFAPFYL